MSLCIHTQTRYVSVYIYTHTHTLHLYKFNIYKYIHDIICISLRNSTWHIVSARYYYIYASHLQFPLEDGGKI